MRRLFPSRIERPSMHLISAKSTINLRANRSGAYILRPLIRLYLASVVSSSLSVYSPRSCIVRGYNWIAWWERSSNREWWMSIIRLLVCDFAIACIEMRLEKTQRRNCISQIAVYQRSASIDLALLYIRAYKIHIIECGTLTRYFLACTYPLYSGYLFQYTVQGQIAQCNRGRRLSGTA